MVRNIAHVCFSQSTMYASYLSLPLHETRTRTMTFCIVFTMYASGILPMRASHGVACMCICPLWVSLFQTRSKMMTFYTVYTVYGSGTSLMWASPSVSWRVYTTSISAVTSSTMSGPDTGWHGSQVPILLTRYNGTITLNRKNYG